MIQLILPIILEGMKTWNQERRLAFKKKYHDILGDISDAENASYPHYTDAALMLSNEALENFLKAYHDEFIAHNNEAGNA